MIVELTLMRPDEMHHYLRDGTMTRATEPKGNRAKHPTVKRREPAETLNDFGIGKNTFAMFAPGLAVYGRFDPKLRTLGDLQ